MRSSSFDIFAGWCAVLAGIVAVLYAIAFIVVRQFAPETGTLLTALFLTLNGILGTVALTALWSRFRDVAAEVCEWAYLIGFFGAMGSAVHGAFDLANAIHPSAIVAAAASGEVPNQVDPRGFLAFFASGLALLAFSSLIVRTKRLPRSLGIVGYASAVLLILLFLARLIIVSPAHPVVVALDVLNGLILTPVWYIGLGLALWRGVTRVVD